MSVINQSQDSMGKLRESNRFLSPQISSLNQLTQLYGKSRPSDIAQSLVYGDKPKTQQKENKPMAKQSMEPYKSFNSTQSMYQLPPSKLTLLSQQLFNHVHNSLEEHKSQRAFYQKDHNILLSPQRLHSLPNQQGNGATQEVANRLIQFTSFVNDKKKNLKDQVDSELLAECSFQPSIDPRSRQIAVKGSSKDIRSADSFHEDQMKHLQNIQDKREQALKQQQESIDQELTQPKLGHKTIKLTQKHCQQPVVDRLYVRSQSSVTENPSELSYSFKPEISKRSKMIKREQTVEDYLYQDAQTRRVAQTLIQTQVIESVIQPTDKSCQWFVQRFIKEFYFQLSGLERIQESKDYSKILPEEMQSILVGLGFGRSEELWHVLNQGFHVLSRNLLVGLLAILAVPLDHIQIPLYKPKVEENVQLTSTYKVDENGNLILTQEDCQQIHKRFYNLFLNTKQQHGNGVRRQQARSPQQIRGCSPKLSMKSMEYAQNKKANINLYDWFELQEQKRKENLELLKEQVHAEEIKELRTINRPITINLAELSKPQQKKEDRTIVDVEYENQQQHCTFQPTISKSQKFISSSDKVVQEIEKQASRMKEARVRQKTLEVLKQKGATTNNSSRNKQKAATAHLQSIETKEEKVKSKPMFENVPLLFVDVNIEDGKTARIIVYEGDQSDQLARQFAQMHNLDEGMREKLKELLDQQINSILTKIDEEYEDDQ